MKKLLMMVLVFSSVEYVNYSMCCCCKYAKKKQGQSRTHNFIQQRQEVENRSFQEPLLSSDQVLGQVRIATQPTFAVVHHVVMQKKPKIFINSADGIEGGNSLTYSGVYNTEV